MTQYCALSDIAAAYGDGVVLELTDRDRDDVADPAVVAAALDAAAAEIDGWLAKRYATPLVNPPPRIKQAAVVIAWHALHQGNGLRDNDPVRLDYGNQIKWLQAVASGAADLPGVSPAGAGGGAAAASGAAFIGPARVFSRGSLGGL